MPTYSSQIDGQLGHLKIVYSCSCAIWVEATFVCDDAPDDAIRLDTTTYLHVLDFDFNVHNGLIAFDLLRDVGHRFSKDGDTLVRIPCAPDGDECEDPPSYFEV